jgi:hypothetical protein
MTCRGVLVLVLATGTGCADDVPTLYATTTALVRIDLAPPSDNIPTALGHYSWELVESPVPLHESFDVGTADLTVALPTRGIYVFDRWFVGQAAEQLSYHVVVTVDGVAPMARIVGSTMVVVDTATTLDGSTSASPESRMLSFQWRLASRPASSATELADTTSPMLMLVPDVAGDYGVELRVFDGELWSAPAMISLAAR